MLLAKSETKASEYSKLLQSCKAHKVYLCISDGRFEKNEVCPIEHEREVQSMEWIDSVGIKVDVPIGVVSHKQGVYRCDEQGRV